MTTIKKSLIVAFLGLIALLSACTPTYMAAPPYNPGYDPNSFYYDSAFPNTAYVGGVQGYYYGGVFRPMVTLGGVYGFYGVDGRFHTSHVNRTTVINNYNTGRLSHESRYSSDSYRPSSSVSTPGGYSKPDYTNTSPATRPAYGSQSGGVTRGYQPQATAPTRPSYGSQSGGVTRGYQSSSPSVSRPSYGSQSGGAYRSSTPSSSYSRSSSSSSSSSSRSSSSTRR